MKKCSVYIIKCQSVKPYPVKIGLARNCFKRLEQLQTGNPYKLVIERVIDLNTKAFAYEFESFLHREFSELNIRNEWFANDGMDIDRAIKKWNSISSEESVIVESPEMTKSYASECASIALDGMTKSEAIEFANALKDNANHYFGMIED